MDRLMLDAPTLLVAARAVGLAVARDGDRLSVNGPTAAGDLARLLLEHKAGILAALTAEPSPAGPPGPQAARIAPLLPPIDRREPDRFLSFPEALAAIERAWGCAPIAGRAAPGQGPRDVRQED